MMDRNERIGILAPYPLVVKDQAAIEEAVIGAVADMKKLEKIEQIVKAWNDMNSFDSMVQISEVLEGGNDENVLVGCIGCKYSGVSKHAVCNSCINMNRYEQEVLEDGKDS